MTAPVLVNYCRDLWIDDTVCDDIFSCYGIDYGMLNLNSFRTFLITMTSDGCWNDPGSPYYNADSAWQCTAPDGGDCGSRTGGRSQSGGRLIIEHQKPEDGPPLPASLNPEVVKQTIINWGGSKI